MTYNMGTGGWPESIEHWTSKEELFRLLRRKQRRQEPFGLFYVEDCPRCEGGGYVENILWDVVRVEMEATSHGFRPDILLRRTDGTEVWLEIVATSTPSDAKLAVCERAGIDLFEINGENGPIGPDVLMKAHITSSNCRRAVRQRLLDLWRRLSDADGPLADGPLVGVKQDFRSVERREREFDEHRAEMHGMRDAVLSGAMVCLRCKGSLSLDDGDGFAIHYRFVHRENEACGQYPFCQPCDLHLQIGDNWEAPAEAASWGLDSNCARCVAIQQDQQEEMDRILGDSPRTLPMPWGPGVRMVSEPTKRTRSFVVGDGQGKTVGLREFQSIVFLLQESVLTIAQWSNEVYQREEITDHARRRVLSELEAAYKQFDKMLKLGWPANNFPDHDWIAGVGDSFVSEEDEPLNDSGDCLLRIRSVMPKLKPNPFSR